MFDKIYALWAQLIEHLHDRGERNAIVREFNNTARNAFINGVAPTLLKAQVSKGDPNYKHNFSWSGSSGFRIEVLSGRSLSKEEIKTIGSVILSNDILVRKLVAFGWDTLEIHGDIGMYGCKWRLREFIAIGG